MRGESSGLKIGLGVRVQVRVMHREGWGFTAWHPESRMWGFRVSELQKGVVPGSGFRGSGFGVRGSGFRAQGSGLRVQGPGFGVQGSGFRVQGSGYLLLYQPLRGFLPDCFHLSVLEGKGDSISPSSSSHPPTYPRLGLPPPRLHLLFVLQPPLLFSTKSHGGVRGFCCFKF